MHPGSLQPGHPGAHPAAGSGGQLRWSYMPGSKAPLPVGGAPGSGPQAAPVHPGHPQPAAMRHELSGDVHNLLPRRATEPGIQAGDGHHSVPRGAEPGRLPRNRSLNEEYTQPHSPHRDHGWNPERRQPPDHSPGADSGQGYPVERPSVGRPSVGVETFSSPTYARGGNPPASGGSAGSSGAGRGSAANTGSPSRGSPLSGASVGGSAPSVPYGNSGGGFEPFPQPQSQSQQSMRADGRGHVPGDRGKQNSKLPASSASTIAPTEDYDYLKKNNEYLRNVKHKLEERMHDLENRVVALEKRKQQYKMLYSQAQRSSQYRGTGEQELGSLHEQLEAVVLLKDALNTENMELQRRLEAATRSASESKQAACVICMDNLANLVCLPCKHLALCGHCEEQQNVTDCPICRTVLTDKMQIYTP